MADDTGRETFHNPKGQKRVSHKGNRLGRKGGLRVITAQERNQIWAAARDGHAPSGAPTERLTDKQEAFCQAVAAGNSFADAYREAYDTSGCNEITIQTQAHLLTKNHKVTARIASLIAKTASEERVIEATRAARVTSFLENMMKHGQTDNVRVKAADLLAKTLGLYAKKDGEEAETVDPEELEARLDALLKRHGTDG